jgi:D-inositol-3-phosphate glycosyltransferase
MVSLPTVEAPPLRICLISQFALPHIGGVEVVVGNLARALRECGHDVEQIAARPPSGDALFDDAGPRGDLVPPRTVRASHLLQRLTGLQYPIVGVEFVREVRRAVRRCDVVHAHDSLPLTSAAGLMLATRQARANSRPVRVLTEHSSMRVHDSRFHRALESAAIGLAGRMSLRSAQAVIPINSRVAEDVDALSPGKLVPPIPNGVDVELYRPPEDGEPERIRAELGWDDRPRLLSVGRVSRLKGADLALEVATRLGADVEIVLAGPGDPGVARPNVTGLGALPRREVARLYRAADCLLHSSRVEGFPLVLQEAMASGLPAVIADDPGYEQHLADAPPGVLRVARDGEAMVNALRGLDLGRAVSAQDRSAMVEFARARFSWARSAAQHEGLYRELLGATGGGAEKL